MFGRGLIVMAIVCAALGTTAACGGTTSGTPVPTSTSGADNGRVEPARWVDAVCTGYRETFGSAPTEQELDNPDVAALKQRILDYLDTHEAAARDASIRMSERGPPDISSRGKQIHRDMIGNFDDIASKAGSEREMIESFDLARDPYKFELMAVSLGALHPYGLDIMEDNEELDAAVEKSTECATMYDELKHLMS